MEINKETLKRLEDYFWGNLARNNDDETGLEYWLSSIAEGDIANPLEEKLFNCDNTSHKGGKVKKSEIKDITLNEDFDYDTAFWCKECIERDNNILDEDLNEETMKELTEETDKEYNDRCKKEDLNEENEMIKGTEPIKKYE